MSLPLNKREILETMLINDKPAKATDIAKETGRDFKPVMMHILGLIRMGYAYTPEKGLYVITEKGKQALGLPETSKEAAKTIIAHIPSNKAFHFYCDIGKPLNVYACSLQDFCEQNPESGRSFNRISLEARRLRSLVYRNWRSGNGQKSIPSEGKKSYRT